MIFTVFQQLTKNSEIQDVTGKSMKVLTVISSCIKYLKTCMQEMCDKQCTGVKEKDITWVVTVPTIWSDAAKQIMRLSAEKVRPK